MEKCRMKKHLKIYRDYFKIADDDIVLCENCGAVSADIHHIYQKGIGGSKTKDYIENLIALCRKCHNRAHGIEQPKIKKSYLIIAHMRFYNHHKNY